MSSNDSEEKSVQDEVDVVDSVIDASNSPQVPTLFPPPMPRFHPSFMYPMPMPRSDVNSTEPLQQQLHPMFPPFPIPYPGSPFSFENSAFPPAGFVPGPYPQYPPMMFVPVPMPFHDATNRHLRPDSVAPPILSENVVSTPDTVKPIDLDLLTSPSTSSSVEGFDAKMVPINSVDSSTQADDLKVSNDEDPNDEEMMQSRVLRLRLKRK